MGTQYPCWIENWVGKAHYLVRMKDVVAWLQISQMVLVRVLSLSLLAKFVKGFLAKFLLDIIAFLSYKASESFLVCTAYTPL
jgi:hypothetical protein